MRHDLYALLCDEEAATAVEYALIIAAIAAAILVTVSALGLRTKELFERGVNAFTPP